MKRNLRQNGGGRASNSEKANEQGTKRVETPDLEDLKDNPNYDDVKKITEQYSGKSQNELMRELQKMMASGAIGDKQFEYFRNTVMPMLPKDQQRNAEELLKKLK